MTANKRIEADLRKRASPAYSAAVLLIGFGLAVLFE